MRVHVWRGTLRTIIRIGLIGAAGGSGCSSSSTMSVTGPTADGHWGLSVSPGAPAVEASGGSGTLSIVVSRECSWSAKSSVDWVTIGPTASGPGSGTVAYAVAANTVVSPRQGQIVVNDQSVPIQQAAAPCV